MFRLGFLIPVGFATIAALGIALVSTGPRAIPEAAAVTGPSFSIVIAGSACHPSGGGADCDVDPNTIFTVGVHLTKTNLPLYRGFQVKLTSPAELPYLNRPGQQEIVWPDCIGAYDWLISATTYQAGCTRFGTSAASTYLGEMLQVDYRCVVSSSTIYTITMPQGATGDNTYLVDNTGYIVNPEGGPSRTLALRCFGTTTPPGPTETPLSTGTATPPEPTSTHRPPAPPTATATPQPVKGDVNCDDRADSFDAALILQFSASLISALPCQQNADVNHDGSIDAIDAALILQYAAGLLSQL